MDLAKQAKIVDSIHDTLHDFVGQRLKVRANMGRSKIVESEGVLMQVHPQLFILEVDRKRGRTSRQSYQYVDVLTGIVELSQVSANRRVSQARHPFCVSGLVSSVVQRGQRIE